MGDDSDESPGKPAVKAAPEGKGGGSRPGSKQGSRRGSGTSATSADGPVAADGGEVAVAAGGRGRKKLGMSMFRSAKRGKSPLVTDGNTEMVVGRLEGCPVDVSVYDTEWEKFKAKGWPRRVSRLYDNVDGVLRDPHCLRYFVAYLKSEKLTPLLKFWSAAEKFAQGNFENVEAPPGTSTEATAVLVAQDLYDKYIAVDGLDLPDAVRTPLVGLLGADAPPTTVALTAFRGAQTFVHGRLKDEQFVKFATSPQYSQYCISILSSGTVRVEDMLYSEPFRAEFMDYMIREDCANIMNFWIIASEFQISVTAKEPDGKLKNDEKTMMGDARGISSRYAGPDAMEPIGLDEVVLSDMDKRLKAGKVSNCFVRALHTVYVAVGSFFFLEYLQSPAFQQYLKGLHSVANPEAKTKSAPSGVKVGAAGEGDDLVDKKKTMIRTHSLGSIDEWGVYQRDDEATNPLFAEKSKGRAAGVTYVMKRSVGIKPKSKAEQQAEEESALQEAKDAIEGIFSEMKAHSTIDEILQSRAS